MRRLDTLTLRNFKSIREQKLRLGPLNVFIGAKRVLILVERHTEERFVKDVLAPEFYAHDLYFTPTLLVAKRVAYRKTVHGPLAAQRIGLHRIREECPHFATWLRMVEEF